MTNVNNKIESMKADFITEQADLEEAAMKARNADNDATSRRWDAEVTRHRTKITELEGLLSDAKTKYTTYETENKSWSLKAVEAKASAEAAA